MKNLLYLAMAWGIMSCNTTQNMNDTENATNGRKVENASVRNSSSVRTNSSTKEVPQGIPVAHNKAFIKNYFDETYFNLDNAVKGLSPEQLNFKSAPDKWSILECMEHIVISESMLFEMEKAALKNQATPERRSEIKVSDDEVMTMLVNRNFKAKAPAEIAPSGKYKEVQSALTDLKSGRKLMMNELDKFTMENLRNRVVETPIGAIDAYQFMLFLPGHTTRHTLQIQEVKSDPNFPKS